MTSDLRTTRGQVSRTFCDGNQGDIVVYKDILVRAWNTPAGTTGPFGAGLTCDGQAVPAGFEGVHVFDISDKSDPELVADIELSARPQADTFGCGSHTLTLVPDRRNDRVLIYNQTSGGPCPFVSILEVPLDAPEDAQLAAERAARRGGCRPRHRSDPGQGQPDGRRVP